MYFKRLDIIKVFITLMHASCKVCNCCNFQTIFLFCFIKYTCSVDLKLNLRPRFASVPKAVICCWKLSNFTQLLLLAHPEHLISIQLVIDIWQRTLACACNNKLLLSLKWPAVTLANQMKQRNMGFRSWHFYWPCMLRSYLQNILVYFDMWYFLGTPRKPKSELFFFYLKYPT